MIHSNTQAFCHRLNCRANAWAAIRGTEECPNLLGSVKFFQTTAGVLVLAEIWGLPETETGFFGFHIHEGDSCKEAAPVPSEGAGPNDRRQNFPRSGGHLNPQGHPHPLHMGDLPPLMAKNGYAWGACLTSRFVIRDILGRTVILHEGPDDFTSQPAGNAGRKIACGEIRGV